jgi:hypothetical protein
LGDDEERAGRIVRLQERIDAALAETPAMRTGSTFSDYDPTRTDRFDALFAHASREGGVAGLERALDAFDDAARTADPLALRRDLMVFLARHQDVARLGLRIPSLGTRSPWKTLPSKRR